MTKNTNTEEGRRKKARGKKEKENTIDSNE